MDIRETNSDYEMEKYNLQIFTFFKKCLRQLLFLEIVSVTKIKNCLDEGGRLLKELDINNSLFNKILKYSLQLNKNYFFLFILLSSVIK